MHNKALRNLEGQFAKKFVLQYNYLLGWNHFQKVNKLYTCSHPLLVFVIPAEFACLDFPLSEEPNFGTWRIQANLKVIWDEKIKTEH